MNKYTFKYCGESHTRPCDGWGHEGWKEKDGVLHYVEYEGDEVIAPNEKKAWEIFLGRDGKFGIPEYRDYDICLVPKREINTMNTNKANKGVLSMEGTTNKNGYPKELADKLSYMRKSLVMAAKNGTLCCLPDAGGNVDTSAAMNPVTGYTFTGINQLLAKQFIKDNKAPAAECVTFEQVQASGTYLSKGVKGFSAVTVDKTTGDLSTTRYFSTAQTVNPEKIAELVRLNAEKRMQPRQNQNEQALAMQKERGGDARLYGYREAAKEKGPLSEIKCSLVTPEGYIGQYLAAVASGAKFTVKREQAETFVKNLSDTLYEQNAQGHTNPFKLVKISNEANRICKETLKQAYQQTRQQHNPAHGHRREVSSMER